MHFIAVDSSQEAPSLCADQIFVLMVLCAGGTLSESVWYDRIRAAGLLFDYDWFVDVVSTLEKREYVVRIGHSDEDEFDQERSFTATEAGSWLVDGKDMAADFVDADGKPLSPQQQ